MNEQDNINEQDHTNDIHDMENTYAEKMNEIRESMDHLSSIVQMMDNPKLSEFYKELFERVEANIDLQYKRSDPYSNDYYNENYSNYTNSGLNYVELPKRYDVIKAFFIALLIGVLPYKSILMSYSDNMEIVTIFLFSFISIWIGLSFFLKCIHNREDFKSLRKTTGVLKTYSNPLHKRGSRKVYAYCDSRGNYKEVSSRFSKNNYDDSFSRQTTIYFNGDDVYLECDNDQGIVFGLLILFGAVMCELIVFFSMSPIV